VEVDQRARGDARQSSITCTKVKSSEATGSSARMMRGPGDRPRDRDPLFPAAGEASALLGTVEHVDALEVASPPRGALEGKSGRIARAWRAAR
jgi:hypothetical protein